MGHPILMGRKTHESIGRPLPGRRNLVLSRDRAYQSEGCSVVNSVEAALEVAGSDSELMVIGGEAVYRLTLPLARRIYLTRVHRAFAGSVLFPDIDAADWREVRREDHAADARNPHDYSFVWLERRDSEATRRS